MSYEEMEVSEEMSEEEAHSHKNEEEEKSFGIEI